MFWFLLRVFGFAVKGAIALFMVFVGVSFWPQVISRWEGPSWGLPKKPPRKPPTGG